MRFRSIVLTLGLVGLMGCGSGDPAPPVPLEGLEDIAHGRDLAEGLAACGFCHSQNGVLKEPLSGGRLMSDSYGSIQGPNITLASSGIGDWSEAQVFKLFRGYVKPDETTISKKHHYGFEWLSDRDLAAVIAYLRALPPIENDIPKRPLSFIDRNTTGFMETTRELEGIVPDINRRFTKEYGQYLADHVARCGSCHNTPGGVVSSDEYLGGGATIYFDGNSKVAPNITTSEISGIGQWTESDLLTFFSVGRTPDGRSIDPHFCPVQFYRNASTDDVKALVAFLRTVSPLN